MPGRRTLVAVIAGGDTAECEASIDSGRHAFALISPWCDVVLLKFAHGQWALLDACVQGSAEGVAIVPNAHLFAIIGEENGNGKPPDVALICMHGYPGETGELQGALTIAGIPFCGSGVLASALAADKQRCAQFLRAAAIHTPRQDRLTAVALRTLERAVPGFPVPFVLKPASLGSSIGVLSVHDEHACSSAFAEAAALGCDYIVENFVSGTELTVGAVAFRDETVVFPEAEVLRAPTGGSDPVRRYADHKSARLRLPARIPRQASEGIRDQMGRIGNALGLVGCYRADFIWTDTQIYFLEVNTVPGIGARSAFTRIAKEAGFDMASLLRRLIDEAVETGRRPHAFGEG